MNDYNSDLYYKYDEPNRAHEIETRLAEIESDLRRCLEKMEQVLQGIESRWELRRSRPEATVDPGRVERRRGMRISECERMRDELETERMRLAACGAAALGYFDGCHDTYKSASLSDVLALYARAEKAEAALAEKTAECERMQVENEQLSAGVCTHLIGDERGNPTCAAREQLAVLTLEYEDRLAELEAALAENTRLQAALRRHGVAIVYGDRDVGMHALRARAEKAEAALAAKTTELEDVSLSYQIILEDIDEYLPEYQMDRADGECDEANERERIEYAAAELADLKVRAEKAEAECERMRGLIEELCDEEECSYDHHGYCQTHSLHPKPCPHERARATLAAKTAEMKYHNGANLRARQDDPIKVELMALATECKGRADHCGRLARAVLAAADGEEE